MVILGVKFVKCCSECHRNFIFNVVVHNLFSGKTLIIPKRCPICKGSKIKGAIYNSKNLPNSLFMCPRCGCKTVGITNYEHNNDSCSYKRYIFKCADCKHNWSFTNYIR